jgi:xylulokinase
VTPFVLAVDVATAEVRAVAVDALGRVLASASRPLPAPQRDRPGWSEQQSLHADTAERVLADVAAQLGGSASAVTVTATSGSVVPCSADLEATGPALLYDDRRAADPGSGVDPALVRAAPALARMAWLHRHRPACRYAHTGDVVLARLAGRAVPTDTSSALKTGADPGTASWPAALLATAGLEAGHLPELALPTRVAGVVGRAAAATTGILPGTPLLLGMTDGCAGQVAAGAVLPRQRASVLGTTLVLKTVALRPVTDPELGVYSHLSPDGAWWAGGASNAGAGVLRTTDGDLRGLDEAAGRRGPADVLRYPVGRPGERFPFVASEAGGPLYGESRDAVESHRALLDGVAYVERLGFEVLAGRGAVGAGPVRAVGGGANSTVWLRIRATVLGQPIEVPAEPSSGFGAAVLAASASLHDGLGAAVAAMVSVARTVDPDPRQQPSLESGYQRFVGALEQRGWLTSEFSRTPHPIEG